MDGAEQSPGPRPPREAYCVVQIISLAATAAGGWIAKGFEQIFNQLEMKSLPAPTELLLGFGHFVRSPIGGILFFLAGGVLITQAVRGKLDPWIKALIRANVLWMFIYVPLTVLALYVPILKIQKQLSDQ